MVPAYFECHYLVGIFMEEKPKRTPTYIAAEEMLPAELRPQFEQLVAEYQFASFKHHGMKFASPKVLAELMLMGWRSSVVPSSRERS